MATAAMSIQRPLYFVDLSIYNTLLPTNVTASKARSNCQNNLSHQRLKYQKVDTKPPKLRSIPLSRLLLRCLFLFGFSVIDVF